MQSSRRTGADGDANDTGIGIEAEAGMQHGMDTQKGEVTERDIDMKEWVERNMAEKAKSLVDMGAEEADRLRSKAKKGEET
jgi:hypothetical protein